MFPICDKKDFENFLIVIFALTILSRSILVVLECANNGLGIEGDDLNFLLKDDLKLTYGMMTAIFF